MGVKTENKMAYEPVNKLIIQMSAPPLISMFFQYSYNLVDSMFVAGINEQALAAVSLAFPITTLMNALSVWRKFQLVCKPSAMNGGTNCLKK